MEERDVTESGAYKRKAESDLGERRKGLIWIKYDWDQMKRTAEVKREDCDWLNKLPENLEILQSPGEWTWRENTGSVLCSGSQGVGDELCRAWGGLRLVEVLRMELGLFEKDWMSCIRKVEVQLGSEHRNLRR